MVEFGPGGHHWVVYEITDWTWDSGQRIMVTGMLFMLMVMCQIGQTVA